MDQLARHRAARRRARQLGTARVGPRWRARVHTTRPPPPTAGALAAAATTTAMGLVAAAPEEEPLHLARARHRALARHADADLGTARRLNSEKNRRAGK